MHILIYHIVSLIAQKYTLTKYLQKLNIYDLSTSTLCSKEMNQMSFDAINDQERWDRKNGRESKNKYSNAKIQLCVLKKLFASAVTIGLNFGDILLAFAYIELLWKVSAISLIYETNTISNIFNIVFLMKVIEIIYCLFFLWYMYINVT